MAGVGGAGAGDGIKSQRFYGTLVWFNLLGQFGIMPNMKDAIQKIEIFRDGSLKKRIGAMEKAFSQAHKDEVQHLYADFNIDLDLLHSALAIKRVASQINEIIHSVGILLLLPYILNEDEIIEYMSLGAGNTGREFDLETNYRIAEFKFIHWQGADSIRQNTFFKDFYSLAEAETAKRRYLYVIGDEYPLKFLRGKRALRSVMSKDSSLQNHFQSKYGDRFKITSDYYHSLPSELVEIIDVTQYIPDFAVILNTVEAE